MLKRVISLRASRDARLNSFTGKSNRQKGLVGIAVPSGLFPGFSILTANGTGENLGVYRADELEPVTDTEIVLEGLVLKLLSIFPNQKPERVVSFLNAGNLESYTQDAQVVAEVVPMLRKFLENSPLSRIRKNNRKGEKIEQEALDALDEIDTQNLRLAESAKLAILML